MAFGIIIEWTQNVIFIMVNTCTASESSKASFYSNANQVRHMRPSCLACNNDGSKMATFDCVNSLWNELYVGLKSKMQLMNINMMNGLYDSVRTTYKEECLYFIYSGLHSAFWVAYARCYLL